MNLRKIFNWFSTFAILVSTIGVFPVSAPALISHLVTVGPNVIPASAISPDQVVFRCQVGLSPFVCYNPAQMRHAYNVDTLINAGYTGAGRTIVIVDAFQSPTLPADLDLFDSTFGLPARSNGFFTQVAPDGLTPFDVTDGNMVGWSQEITLDVEWAHAIAPGANVVLDLAKSNNDVDILSATKYAVDHNLGDVISQSFGENESCVDPNLLKSQHKMFADATRKHITLLASSGDQGAAQQTCDGNSWVQAASSPASDPLVTAVGGTELHAANYCLVSLGCDPTVNPAPGTYQGEIAWNEFNSESTGGGFSLLYKKPSYQEDLVRGKKRGVPDVSYNAAIYHGVLVAYAGGFYLFGGTSCGSPQWAGIVAIADQKAGRDLGFLNPAFYEIGKAKKAYAATFHDITVGTNSVVEADILNNPVSIQGFNAVKGWDAATGLGSPISDQLVKTLIKFASDDASELVISQSDPDTSGLSSSSHEHVSPH